MIPHPSDFFVETTVYVPASNKPAVATAGALDDDDDDDVVVVVVVVLLGVVVVLDEGGRVVALGLVVAPGPVVVLTLAWGIVDEKVLLTAELPLLGDVDDEMAADTLLVELAATPPDAPVVAAAANWSGRTLPK